MNTNGLLMALISAVMLGAASGAQGAEILFVEKSATLCDSAEICPYTNPQYRLRCSFQDDGRVHIERALIFGMAGPVSYIPGSDAQLSSSELGASLAMAKALVLNPPKLKPVKGRNYTAAGKTWAGVENFRIPTLSQVDQSLSVAAIFPGGGVQLDSVDALSLIDLADTYCGWNVLKPFRINGHLTKD